MLPIVSTASNFAQPPASLVATPLPDTSALRAPTNTVPPSFSTPVVTNNARGNGQAYATPDAALEAAVSGGEGFEEIQGIFPRAQLPGVVSSTFLAQLIGQPPPAALQGTFNGVLSGYAETIVRGLVKYKPSYASLPQPRITSAFTQAVEQERAARAPQPETAKVEALREEVPVIPVEEIAASAPVETAPAPDAETTSEAPAAQPAPISPNTIASKAYTESVVRIESFEPPRLISAA